MLTLCHHESSMSSNSGNHFVHIFRFVLSPKQIASMGFQSNGKPGRIYHWNLPVLKKMLSKSNEKLRKSSSLRSSNDVNDLIDIKNIPTWTKPWDENGNIDKAFDQQQKQQQPQPEPLSVVGDDDLLKMFKKKSPTYYAPMKQKKSGGAKYFPGNGKPKSFYVIKKNQHKPLYQTLIP